MAYRLRTVAEWARYRRSQATDPDTVLLLGAVRSSLEAQARAAELTLADVARDTERINALALADRPGDGRSQ